MKKVPITQMRKNEDSGSYAPQSVRIVTGIVVLLLGLTVIIGWYSGNLTLIKVLPSFVPMVYNTALGFVLCGVSLLLGVKGFRRVQMALSSVVLLIGLLTTIEYMTGSNFGIDELLMSFDVGFPNPNPGRMALSSAICFALSGAAFLIDFKKTGKHFAIAGTIGATLIITGIVGVTGTVIGKIAIDGYFMNIPTAYQWAVFSIMAFHTAFGFIFLGAGILAQNWNGFKTKAKKSLYLLPTIIGFGMLALTLNFYLAFYTYQRMNVHQAIDGQASTLEYAVENGIRERILGLERMGGRWTRRGGTPFDEWQPDAVAYNKNFQTFQTIEWVDSNFTVRWVEPLAGNEAALDMNLEFEKNRRNALDKSLRDQQTIVSKTIELKQGGRGFLIYVPVYRKNEFDGFILGVSNVETLLRKLLPDELKNDYSIAVLEDGRDLYNDETLNDSPEIVWHDPHIINLTDNEWQIKITPRPATLVRLKSKLPEGVLLAGLFFSLLLAATVYLLQKAQRETAEIRRAQNEIGKREELYRTLVLNIPKTAVVIFDRDFRYTLADGVQLQEHGFSSEMFEGKTLQDVFPPEVFDEWEKTYSRALDGESLIFETENDGKSILTHVLPVRNDEGEVFSGMVMWRDVTETKRMEKALREANILHKAILNSANSTIISTSPDGTITTFNQTAEHWLGYSAEEVVGRETPAIIHDSDEIVERAAELTEELGETVEPGFDVFTAKAQLGLIDEHEWTYLCKDGSHFPVTLSITALRDEEGQITGFLGIGSDITERRQMENELQKEREFLLAVLENISDGIVACDSEGRLTIFNRVSREMHGLSANGKLEPEKWAEFYDLYLEDGKTLMELEDIPLVRVLRGEPVNSLPMVISPKNQAPYQLTATGRAIFDRDGEKLGAVVVMHDITEQKRAAKEIRFAEERFKTFMNNSPAVSFLKDSGGNYLFMNKTMERTFGVSTNGSKKVQDSDFMPAELALDIKEKDQKVIETGKMLEYMQTVASADGITRSWKSYKFPVYDGFGKTFIGVVAFDVTEQQKAEKALRKSEQHNRDLIEKSPGLISTHTLDGVLLSVNPAAADALGYKPEELIGKSLRDFIPPDRQALFEQFVEQVRANKGLTGTMRVINKQGEERTWSYTNTVYEKDGEPYVLGHAFDITESRHAENALRRSEEYNRNLIDKSPGFICTHSLDGTLTMVNPSAAKALGYKPEEMVGKSLREFIDPDVRNLFGNYLKAISDNKNFTGLMRVVCKDGDLRIWSFSNSLYEDGDNRYVLGHAFDTTESKKAENALRQSEERMRVFVENTPAAVAMLDRDMRYVMASKRWVSEYDLGDQNIIGRSHYEIFPNISQNRKDIHQRGIKGEIVKRDEDPFPHENGTTEWLRWEMHPWHNDQGEIGGVIFFMEDITERKRIQEELARSAAIVESSQDGIISKDLNGIIKTWNRGAEKVFGYTADEIIGKHISILFPTELIPEEAKFIKEIKNGKYINQYETVRVRKDGSEIPVSLTLSPIKDEKGNITGISKIVRDITEQKEAEQTLRESESRVRNLLEYSPVGIVLTDKDGGVSFINERWSKMTGLTLDQARGEGWTNAVHTEDRERVFNEWMEKAPVEEETTYEFRFQRPDGNITEVITRAIKQYDANGEFAGHLATVADISQIKQLQTDLEVARDAALESAKMKSEFLANMSHEIRTPMNGVIGMTDMLLTTQLDKEQRENAEIIKSSADGLLTIVNDILDFSKIEAGKLSFEVIDFNLIHTIESTVEIFAEQARRKKIEIASLVESDININLRGDPGRLRQILNNLIGNALKFTEKGEVIVRVSKESENAETCRLRFDISDTGIGIKDEAQGFLFQAFTQADGSMTRKFGGTGLGLAISRQLVEIMNGKISLESTFGKGSTFSFTAEFEKNENVKTNKIAELRDLKNMRVLVVDDNSTNRKILVHQLTSWGMIADEAEDGMEALIKLREAAEARNQYDLALLDLMMPGMSGFELACCIRDDAFISGIRMILMPSFGQRGHAQIARENGIAGYLIKPVRQSDLFDCIATLMADSKIEVESGGNKPSEQLITQHLLNENKKLSREIVLVAEDNLVNQKVAKMQLEKLGYRTKIVSNGLEALEAVKLENYSLILMDCQMPEMDGYTAASEIRRNENGSGWNIPIIAMTANAMQGEREKCLAAGMNDYISKPVQMDLLSRTLQRWLTNVEPERKTAVPAINDDKDSEINKIESLDYSVIEGFRELQTPDSSDLVTDLINLFVQDAERRMILLKQAVKENDVRVIKEQAHTFKGSAGNIGARRMAALSKKIEENIDDTNQLAVLFDKIEKEFSEVSETLKNIRKEN